MSNKKIARELMKVAKDLVAKNKLSDDAMLALGQAHGLKSYARNKFENEVYQELIKLRYMKPNKAISKEGRTYLLTDGRDHYNKVFKKSDIPMGYISEKEYAFYKEKRMVS